MKNYLYGKYLQFDIHISQAKYKNTIHVDTFYLNCCNFQAIRYKYHSKHNGDIHFKIFLIYNVCNTMLNDERKMLLGKSLQEKKILPA